MKSTQEYFIEIAQDLDTAKVFELLSWIEAERITYSHKARKANEFDSVRYAAKVNVLADILEKADEIGARRKDNQ